MSYFVIYCVADQLLRLGKRELICLLSFTCNYMVSVRRGFLSELGMDCTPTAFHTNIFKPSL